MPAGQFLGADDRERFDGFPDAISPEDLAAFYTLTEADLKLVLRRGRRRRERLGLAVTICALRHLSFVPAQVELAPAEVVQLVAAQLDCRPLLSGYPFVERTRRTHGLAAAKHLGLRRASRSDLKALRAWLGPHAVAHSSPTVLLDLATGWTRREGLVRPGLTVLERLVLSTRELAEDLVYDELALLIDAHRPALDQLLESDDAHEGTRHGWLLERPRGSTPKDIKRMLEKHAWLHETGVSDWDFSDMHPNRMRYLARVGRTMRPHAIRRMPEKRRYPVLVAFMRQALVDVTDAILAMFRRCLADTYARARRERRNKELDRAGARDEIVRAFETIGVVLTDKTLELCDRAAAIFERLPEEEIERLLALGRGDARPFDSAALEFLRSRYGYVRSFSKRFLAQMDIRSAGDKQLEDALRALDLANKHRRGSLPADSPMSFVPSGWRPFVVTANGIDRGYYELCALWKLREALHAGQAWVPHSEAHAPIHSYVLPEKKWERVRQSAYRLLAAPDDAREALAAKTESLRMLSSSLSNAVGDGQVEIIEGKLRVAPMHARQDNERLADARLLLRARMPRAELLEMLAEVDQWTGFSKHLVHQSDGMPARGEKRKHLLAAVLAQASNVGFTSMARSTQTTFNQLAWTASWHLREETLHGAYSAVADLQSRQAICRHWGGTGLSSSDGQRFLVRHRTPAARALPKYFNRGRGVTVYTALSDTHAQFGVKLIPATAREATYVLDALLDNETSIELFEHTTDTHGYTDLVFALFDLLGYRFAPRLKDIGRWQLFDLRGGRVALPGGLKVESHIDPKHIANHWDEMMRIVSTLKLGHTPASTLIGKLQAGSPKTGPVRALIEYGCICKTEHVLRYCADEALRRRILQQLNKGETIHSLRRFLSYGEPRGLLGRDAEALANQAACLNLVSNAAVLWTTVYMARVIDSLRDDGFELRDEEIARLSPARFEHFDRYGKYRLDNVPASGQFRRILADAG